jgi:hypothetical protein
MTPRALGRPLLGLVIVAGCGATGAPPDQRVGTEGNGGAAGSFGGPGGLGGISQEGGVSNPLNTRIEKDGVTVTIVTLACAGECADVVAVATGGHPPYSFEWEDGSTSAARRVCPTADTSYRVSATDTGIPGGEVPVPPKTASAALTADVLDCPPDGGVPDGGSGTLCLTNPSFEGTPGICEVVGVSAAPWQNCDVPGCPDIWDERQSWNGAPPGGPRATDGLTYLELFATNTIIVARESAGQELCAPLTAGTRYSFTLDLSFRPEGSSAQAAGGLEVWGAAARCGEEQLLWRSPPATRDWQTHCVSFVADRELRHLKLRAAAGYPGMTGVFVDNIAVASCSP